MIIYDEILKWPGSSPVNIDDVNTWENKCRIRIIDLNSSGGVSFLKRYYIVATDMGNGSGTSITNAASVLIPQVCADHNIDYADMVWFEHYPHEDCNDDPTLDVVIPSPAQSCCPSGGCGRVSVAWRPARINEINHVKQFIADI